MRTPDRNLARQREVLDAFFRAARGGDLEGLLAVLDPDVVVRGDFGPAHPERSAMVRGAMEVARQAQLYSFPTAVLHPALVNGAAGVVVTVSGRPFSVMAFTVVDGRIVEIDAIADPERVARVAASVLGEPRSAPRRAGRAEAAGRPAAS